MCQFSDHILFCNKKNITERHILVLYAMALSDSKTHVTYMQSFFFVEVIISSSNLEMFSANNFKIFFSAFCYIKILKLE